MATCTNCGAKLEENGKFCVMCGTKVEGEEVVETVQPAPTIETMTTPPPQNLPVQPLQPEEPQQNETPLQQETHPLEDTVADQAVANALNNPANYPNGMPDPQQPIEASETEVLVPSNANIDMSKTLREETPTLQSLETATSSPTAKPIPKMDSNIFKSKRPKKKSGNQQIFQIVGLVAGSIVALVIIGFLFIFMFQFITNSNFQGNEPQGPKLELNSKNSYRVGSKDYGYVSVPNSWVPFGLSPENQTIQYTDGAGWIVTLYSVEETTITAKGWSNNIVSQMNNVGATDIGIEETQVNDYIGYKIFGYYGSVSTYLAAWVVNGNDGKVHYIAIEGPERFNDFYDIIYTFETKK